MEPRTPDDTSSLERTREQLYSPHATQEERPTFRSDKNNELPNKWNDEPLKVPSGAGARHVHIAGVFFIITVLFFLISIAVAGYYFYSGGNSVSADKISVDIVGPTTIAGGDTVSLSISITNKNPVALDHPNIEIEFPDGTRSADNVLDAYPRYTESFDSIESGGTVTRSVKAVIFAGSGSVVTIPISLSFGASGSNAVFVKKLSYPVTISTSPLSVSVDSLSEAVSGKVLPITLTVRSNATVPLNNVVVSGAFPVGFAVVSSSVPVNNSSFLLGTLQPGDSRTINISGTLSGQDKEQRVFHFTVGTSKAQGDTTLAVKYMEQSSTISLAAPFLYTTLALSGGQLDGAVLSSGSINSVALTYQNTIDTNVTNAVIKVTLAGAAIDYNSIQTSRGFYDSSTRTIIFSSDTDPSLSSLAPGATGIDTFTFSTLPAGTILSSPIASFSVSVSGTRVGQTSVAETVDNSSTYTAKVITSVTLGATSLHSSGPLSNKGPIPPRQNQSTSYAILWSVNNSGSAVAGGTVTSSLPQYVTYTGTTSGSGTFSYNESTRIVSWDVGDIPSRSNAKGYFQVAITPSASQRGAAPALTGPISFSGYDRFAGSQVSAVVDPSTTETPNDPGYVSKNGTVQ